jgi:transposase-like protein
VSVFENTKIPLRDWLFACYQMVTARTGISSMELSKEVGITQKSSWHFEHRIREGMSDDNFTQKGDVEADETLFGGKNKNKHPDKKLKEARGGVGKAKIFGMKERERDIVYMQVVEEVNKETLHPIIAQRVESGSTIHTDEATCYNGIQKLSYTRNKVNHSKKQYVRGKSSTNGIEGVWANVKRSLGGVYYRVSVKHLNRYAKESQFRWNSGNCRYETMDRINSLLAGCWGKKLPYKVLTGKVAA